MPKVQVTWMMQKGIATQPVSAVMSLVCNPTAKFSVLDLPGIKQGGSNGASKGSKSKGSEKASNRPMDDLTGLKKSTMTLEEKVEIAKSVGEEVLTEAELRALFEAKEHPIVYDGFEPSGRMHIAQGVLRAINVNKLTSAGCLFKFWSQTGLLG